MAVNRLVSVVMSEPEIKEHGSANPLSFEGFFTSTFAEVRATTALITDPDLAEDLAVEAFARAFARWTGLQDGEPRGLGDQSGYQRCAR